ncbi:hypothetical protein HGRIS_010811 [Hohenbuehelia grisea]|uniref:Transcription factor CBF/NF-Y/archaeal histone domain-containing protein n=1 Tax=Hohenbuehelia grisea TaxID=104357 RepID=A0ABR3IY72_9AGAR
MKNRNKQTKFPVARIKKIMQKDDEVGKVAQATPIVISKALELFLALTIESASKVTVERGAKKVEAYHLKHAVETTDQLDFLKELVENVPDPSNGGTIDLEQGGDGEGKRRRGKGKKVEGEATTKKRRKKKGAAEEAEPEDAPNGGGMSDGEGGDARMDETNGDPGRGGGSDDDDEWDDNEPYIPRS